MSKVKPILYMLGKGGISVLQTAIFLSVLTSVFHPRTYMSSALLETAIERLFYVFGRLST